MKDLTVEMELKKFCDEHGFAWTYEQAIALKSIDLTHRFNPRTESVSGEGYNADKLVSFKLAVAAGDDLRAGVYVALPGGKLVPVDGFHRTRAKALAGLTVTDGYVVAGFETTADPRYILLAVRLNYVSDSVGMTRAERIAQALYLWRAGTPATVAAPMLGLNPDDLHRLDRVEQVRLVIGAPPKGVEEIPQALLLALFRLKDRHAVLLPLVDMLRTSPVPTDLGERLIRQVAKAPSDIAALAQIDRAKKATPPTQVRSVTRVGRRRALRQSPMLRRLEESLARTQALGADFLKVPAAAPGEVERVLTALLVERRKLPRLIRHALRLRSKTKRKP